MAILNLGQDVANKREKTTAAPIVAKSYPLWHNVRMCRYSSLIKINPFGVSPTLLLGENVFKKIYFIEGRPSSHQLKIKREEVVIFHIARNFVFNVFIIPFQECR